MRRLRALIGSVVLALCSAGIATAAFDPATGVVTDERWKSGVPLGGIGCGDVELFTDGAFGSATINNNWDRPTGLLRGAFAAVWASDGETPVARVLRGQSADEYEGVVNVQGTSYLGMYPRAEIAYRDEALPLQARLEAFCPIIPHNPADSSLPVAMMTVALRNPSARPIEAAALVSWPNFLGYGGDRSNWWEETYGNKQERFSQDGLAGLVYRTQQQYEGNRKNVTGEYLLVTPAGDDVEVTTCDLWDAGGRTVGFWDRFAKTGRLEGAVAPSAPAPTDQPAADADGYPGPRGFGNPGGFGNQGGYGGYRGGYDQWQQKPAGAVAARVTIPANGERRLRFVLVWHLPSLVMTHDEETVSAWSDETTQNVGLAVDGNPKTRWATGRHQMPGDALTIDMQRPVSVERIALDSHEFPRDFPRGYKLESSDDGATWSTVVEADARAAERQQAAGLLAVDFAPVTCRFLRITCTGSDSFYWWSIGELRVAGPAGVVKLEAGGLEASLRHIEKQRVQRDYGHYYQNRFSDAGGIAKYAVQEWDRLYADTVAWQTPVLQSNLPWWLKLKLINCAFSLTECGILTRDGSFSVLESPVDMGGALGTMDQRMAAHAFWTQMFPGLDQSELRLYARCQQPDGRITHFCGNVHEVVGDPNVGYGVTDWPDLTCSWVMQVLKLYRWTGDRVFLRDMWPHVERAMAWLKSADTDGDLIPEGGSTYDYETVPRGAFSYNASCYLGALAAAREMGQTLGEGVKAKGYEERLGAVRRQMMAQLWNDEYFMKWRDPKSRQAIPNSFVAALAGDWLARLGGAGRTLSPDITRRETESLIARHLQPFKPVPPMEVTPDVMKATGTCYLLQHEPYLGCEAIYEGYTEDGLDTLRRVYQVVWEKNKSPWDESLCYNAPDGAQGGLRRYMTCPTTWHVLNALSGVTVDLEAKTLWINPRVLGGASEPGELHVPLYLSTFWAWLDCVPEQKVLKLTVTRVIGDRKDRIERLVTDIDRPAVPLRAPFAIAEGSVLDLAGRLDELHLQPYSRHVEARFVAKRPPRLGISSAKWSATSGPIANRQAGADSEALAFDADPDTRWTTGRPMQPGDWYQLDMGESRRIEAVFIDIKASDRDWPRGLEIDVSEDGKTWVEAAGYDEHDVRSARRKEIFHYWFAPVQCRYVRLVQKGISGQWWWSMGELYVMEAGR